MPEIWFIADEAGFIKHTPTRAALQRIAKDKGWKTIERLAKTHKSKEGHTYRVIKPRDAYDIFRKVHRDIILLIEIDRLYFSMDPSIENGSADNYTRIENVMRYKCHLRHLPPKQTISDGELLEIINNFQSIIDNINAIHDTDPRCLPFFSFERGMAIHTDPRLHTEEGQTAFVKMHGQERNRLDLSGARWELKPREYHGHEELKQHGHPLPRGMHWDVQAPESTIKVKTLYEIWRIPKKHYLNIYPDMFIRPSIDKKIAGDKVWPGACKKTHPPKSKKKR